MKKVTNKITQNQIVREWKRLDFELFENRPNTDKPYPPEVVEKRQLLLYAQVHLAEVSWAKKYKNLKDEQFHIELYNLVMSKYYG